MGNQIKLSKDAQKGLDTYLGNLFSKGEKYAWSDFITKVKTLDGNAEGYKDAIQAKSTVTEVKGKLAKIAESMGIKEATDEKLQSLAESFIKILNETEKEDENEMDNDERELATTELDKDNVIEEAPDEETSNLSSDDASDLIMKIDDLKLTVKSLEAENAEKDKTVTELEEELPEVIEGIVEAAIPEMINIAKKQLLESNSDIRKKLETYNKIAELFNMSTVNKELSEALAVKDFLRNFIKMREFSTGKRIKKMSESKKRISRKGNIISLKERGKTKVVDSEKRKKIIESIKEKLEAKKARMGKEKKPVIKKSRLSEDQRKRINEKIKARLEEQKGKVKDNSKSKATLKNRAERRKKIQESIQRKKDLKNKQIDEGKNKGEDVDPKKYLKESKLRRLEGKKKVVDSNTKKIDDLQMDKNLRNLKRMLN